jgi:hypothetical protein
MGRITVASVLGSVLIVAAAAAPASGRARQDAGDAAPARSARAYKPAQQRQQDDAAEPAARREAPAKEEPSVPAAVTDPEAYKKELDAAREQRDRDLKDAANETDRRRFEKRKEEIFARYAAILAAMRDKYEANQAEAGEPEQEPPQRPGKSNRPGAVRPGSSDRYATPERPAARKRTARREDDAVQPEPEAPARKNEKASRPGRSRGGDNAGGTLEDAQKRLDDENSRHDSVIQQLNKQLADAQASNNKREVRKAERAIEKETTTFEAKKALLESRVKELGGKIEAPARPAVR